MEDLRKNNFTVPLIFLLAVSLSVKAFLVFSTDLRRVEPFEYEEAARSLADGEGLKNLYLGVPYFALVHPVYPGLCALLYRMGGDHRVVLLIQSLCATVLGYLIYLLGRRLFSPLVGFLSALLVVFHPGIWVYTLSKLHSLVFDAAWFTSVLLLLMSLGDSISVPKATATGVFSGLACLARSTIGLFILFGAGWVFWRRRRNAAPGHLTFCILCLLLSAWLVVIPYLMRNQECLGHRTGIVSTYGLNLWLGNNPVASGSAYTAKGQMILETMPKEISRQLPALTEWEQNDLLKREAYRFMKENPAKTVGLFWKKWLSFWWRSPQTGVLYPRKWARVYASYYLVLLIPAAATMVGALLSAKGRIKSEIILTLSLFLTVSLTQSLFFVEGRHRWVIEPVLLIFSAQGIHLVWRYARNRCAGFAGKLV